MTDNKKNLLLAGGLLAAGLVLAALFHFRGSKRERKVREGPLKTRVVKFSRHGQPLDVTEIEEERVREIEETEVLIRVLARPINPSDILYIQGLYGEKPKAFERKEAEAAGAEACGVIEDAGSLTPYRPGQRVFFVKEFGYCGTWSDYVIVDVRKQFIHPIPSTVAPEKACQLFVNPCTVLGMLDDFVDLGLKKGDYILQTAAGSALGKILIQIAKHRGYKTINIIRTSTQAPELRKLGANEVLLVGEDIQKRVFDITEGKGVKFAIDAICGGAVTNQVIKSLAELGTLFCYGVLEKEPIVCEGSKLLFGEVRIQGWWLKSYVKRKKLSALANQVVELIEKNIITLPVKLFKYPENFRDAITYTNGVQTGKAILVSEA